MKKVLIPEYMLTAILSPDLGLDSGDRPGTMSTQVAVARARENGEKTLDTDTYVDQATRASSYFPYPSNGWIIQEEEGGDEVLDTLNLDTVSITLEQLISQISAIDDNDQQVEAALIAIKSIVDKGLTYSQNQSMNRLKEEIKSKL